MGVENALVRIGLLFLAGVFLPAVCAALKGVDDYKPVVWGAVVLIGLLAALCAYFRPVKNIYAAMGLSFVISLVLFVLIVFFTFFTVA